MNKINNRKFYSLLCSLYTYFGREKMPTKDRANLLFDKVRYLKEDIAKKAFNKIMDDFDNMPANIPKAIRKTVWEIQSQDNSNIQEFKPHKLGNCEDCKGSGIFKLRVVVSGKIYEPIKYCSECENWKQWVNDPGVLVSKNMLLHMKITHKPYTTSVSSPTFKNIINDKYDPNNSVKKLKQLASGMLKEIE